MPPPIHQCHASKANGQRCGYNSKFFNDQLCGTHDRMRREYEQHRAQNPWIEANRRPYQLPVWNVPAEPAAPVPEPEVVEVVPEPVAVTECEACGLHLARYRVRNGNRFCSRCEVTRDRPDLPVEQRCSYHLHGGRRKECLRSRTHGHEMCKTHHKITRTAFFKANVRTATGDILQGVDWRIVVAEVRAAPVTSNRRLGDLQREIENKLLWLAQVCRIPELYNAQQVILHPWGHHWGLRMDAEGNIIQHGAHNHWAPANQLPPARTELEGFARDGQNVHTKVVTDMTNGNVAVLLATENVIEATTTDIFTDMVVSLKKDPHLTSVVNVIKDCITWDKKQTCRLKDDWLYRRLLRALWTRIKRSGSFQMDLKQRLWEEMVDSLGMCCDGHINRLANVMVGFDDAFGSQVSTGETLQNRMAAISEMEIETEQKVKLANSVFAELAVPEPDRQAWLEAF